MVVFAPSGHGRSEPGNAPNVHHVDGWQDAGRRRGARSPQAGILARNAAGSANGFGHANVLPEQVLKRDGLATFAKARHPALGRDSEGPIG